MSNSIWKTPDQKPEPNKTIVAKIAQTGFYVDYKTIKGMETLPNFEKWCYIDDLIAQADKAERLEKALMKIATASVRDKASTLIDIACIALNPKLEEGTNDESD